MDRSSRVVRSTGPQPPPLQSESGDSRRHQSCRSEGGATAGEFLKPIMWPIIRSTPDARPGTAPDEKTEMRYPTRASEPAHRRLRSRLLLCTIHQCKNFTMCPRGDGKPCAVYLTGDIRMEWSGRAPALPITSLARPRSGNGSVMPRALALFVLMISSPMVTCWTGSHWPSRP